MNFTAKTQKKNKKKSHFPFYWRSTVTTQNSQQTRAVLVHFDFVNFYWREGEKNEVKEEPAQKIGIKFETFVLERAFLVFRPPSNFISKSQSLWFA